MAETSRPLAAPALAGGVTQRWVSLLLRMALGAVFLYAGLAKAAGPGRFALDIESYRLLPPGIASLAVAYYLPFLEVICALGFCLRATAPGATLLAGGLMSMFTLALATAWARGLEIRCGCFGGDSTGASGAIYLWWLARDGALLAGCIVLWMLLGNQRTAPEAASGVRVTKSTETHPTASA